MAITQTSHALQHGFGISAGALERSRLTEHRLRILRGRDAARLHLISQLRSRNEQIHQQIISVQHALHGLHPGQVYFTPIEAALPNLDPAGIAFHGTADPWARTELITEGCRRLGVPLHLTENADHSMETGDVLRDITILHTILEQTDRWMRQRCI